jgi:arsenite-transporting ATPase
MNQTEEKGERSMQKKIWDVLNPSTGTKFIFFSGKGGVGKTTMSSATAVWLADQGYNTALMSTDLQRSLNDIFKQDIKETPTPIEGVPNLKGISVKVVDSVEGHEGKVMKLLQSLDPEAIFVKAYEAEIMHPAECSCEKAALFEFMEYLSKDKEYDVIVFDTAPTGEAIELIRGGIEYTIQLLNQIKYREKLTEFGNKEEIERQLKQLVMDRTRQEHAIKSLGADYTSFLMIMYAEKMPMMEVERNSAVLEDYYKIPVRGVVINNIIPDGQRNSREFWRSRWEMQDKYIKQTYEKFPNKVIGEVLLLDTQVLGLDTIRDIGRQLYGK